MNFVRLIGGILVISVIVTFFVSRESKKVYDNGIMYSWSMSALETKGKDKLLTVIEQLEIRALYQTFDNDFLKAGDDSFLAEMAGLGVEALHLNGTPEWAFKPDSMINEIDKILLFNASAENPISGIVFDVEPHTAEDYNEPDDYITLVENLKSVYAHAKENGLRMVVVIPYWLESLDDGLLPDIIGLCCDEVSVMNYYSSETISHIAGELALAKQYGKPINTIYELGFGGENTFGSLEEVRDDFEKLYAAYGYEGLRIAYHHLGDIR